MMHEASYRILITIFGRGGGGGGGAALPLDPCNCLKMILKYLKLSLTLMHVVANGVFPSNTALGSFRTVIELVTILFLFADILATHFKNNMAMARINFLTRKSFSESYVFMVGSKSYSTMDGPVRSDRL